MEWFLLAGAVVLLLACVPVSLEVLVRTGGEPVLQVLPRWGGVSWRPDTSSGPRTVPAKEPPAGGRAERPRTARSAPRLRLRQLQALLASEDFLPSLARWLRRLFAKLAPRNIRFHLRLGTGDPDETGRLWGALLPAVFYLLEDSSADVELTPDFLERTFELDARALFRFVPLVLLAVLLGYFCTPAPWRALRRLARS